MAARGFLGAGDLYINRIVGGVKQGIEGPFECDRFEIKANAELRERTSKGKSSYGQIVASAAIAQPFDLNITMSEMDKSGLAIALMGTSSAASQASGTVTDEAFTAKHDKWVPLSKARVSSVVLTTAPAGTTYTLGTDYLVNAELGMIKVLSTGAIANNASLLVDFAHASITKTEILGATSPSVRAEFILDGKNLADDTPCVLTVHEGVVASDAAVDFLSDQFVGIPLPGRLVTPAGYSAPFKIELRDAA